MIVQVRKRHHSHCTTDSGISKIINDCAIQGDGVLYTFLRARLQKRRIWYIKKEGKTEIESISSRMIDWISYVYNQAGIKFLG